MPTPVLTTIARSASASATVPFTTPFTTPFMTAAPRTSPTPAVGSKDFGYFPAVESKTPPVLEFDRALFLTGAAADKASAAHGGESPVPNDYYIVNDNKLLRRLALSPDAKVVGSLQLNSFVTTGDSTNEPKAHTVKDLLAFLESDGGPRTPWHITYGAGGKVSRVEEQYVP